jgi:hypothetical protein
VCPVPFDTYLSPVEALPAVQASTGFWEQWGDFGRYAPKAALNAKPDYISVFVVPRTEYNQLIEGWDPPDGTTTMEH